MSVAVVGAGLAGLAAAIEAAAGGESVTLFDAREHPGGRARTRCEDGFLINEGAHALYIDGAANHFLRELGREPSGRVPNASDGVGIDGPIEGPMPSGLGSLLRTPLLRSDRRRFLSLFARLARLDPARYAELSATETMERLLGEGRGARLGHALFRLSTYGNDPEVASGDAGIQQLKFVLRSGVRYVDDGWQSITDSLLKEAADRGVVLQTGAKIDGDALDELRGAHRSVVLAPGSPRAVAALLDGVCAAVDDWATVARPATVASLDIGLAAPWGDAATFALGVDEPLYLSVHAPVARLAPEGHTLVHVNRYQHPDEADDPIRDRERCEAFIDRVRPDWRDDATHVRFQRRLVAAADQPQARRGGMAGRPPVAMVGESGLFLAGDWVGSEGLLADASVASGRRAGQLAAR